MRRGELFRKNLSLPYAVSSKGSVCIRLFLLTVFLHFFTLKLPGQTVGGATRIFTDYNGYWTSGTGTISSIKPNNSHNLLGFTWQGSTYSTGVNDAVLEEKNVSFSPANYQAFPVRNIGSVSGTYVGMGQLKDGVNHGLSKLPPFPIPPNLANFLTDGKQGLDIGTGVANIKAGELIFDFTGIIDKNQIADGAPDILVSQIADPSSTTDEIFLTDENGERVGNSLSISYNKIGSVGRWTADFYHLNGTSATFVDEDRDLRLWVAELSDFGINENNYQQVKSMRYKLNGTSDPAFAAFKVGVFDILSANDDEGESEQGETVEINVLQNDQPLISLNPASVSILKDAANGEVTVNLPSGTVSYTPDPNFFGTDSFDYEVCSNASDAELCDEAVVQMSVRSYILPVVLLKFFAITKGEQVILNWTTAGEKDNSFFELQWSVNGIDWETIGKVTGAGNSTAPVHYTLRDQHPTHGYNYYRLKQVDVGGGFDFSEVIFLLLEADNRGEVKIYPNPSRGSINLDGDPAELNHITVVNPFGQIQNNVRITKLGDSKILIDLESLPSGMYVIRTSTMGKMVRKF